MTKKIRQSLYIGWLMAGPGGLTAIFAAEPASTTPTEPISTLEKFVVSDVPIEKNILPTLRPIASVMGDDRSLLETPRSVTSVNKAWMEERQVKDAMDFGQFAPGVYSAAQYGIPATPQIRGDLGELYVNGQRTKYSRNSVFPSFNGVEAMDIVKGPGSAVYGPQGQGPGGYVNFVTKKPHFDGVYTEVDATLGYWTSGRSYWNPELTVDTSAPINDKLAYRLSYLSRYGNGYYQNQKNETQDLFAALSFRAAKTLTIDWYGQFYSSRFNEVTGVNRVTQDYINNGNYVTGSVQPTNAFGGSIVGDPSFLLLDPATAKVVKLPAFKTLLGPSDNARAKRFQTQLIVNLDLGANSKLTNLTYFETRSSRKFETYGYDEYVPKDSSIDNRTEFHTNFKLFGFPSKVITGIDLRTERLISYQDFSFEPFFLFDLSKSSSLIDIRPYTTLHNFGGLPVPGNTSYSGNPFPDAGNQDSHIYDYAAFYQQDIQFTSQLFAVIGVRLDQIDADAASSNMVGASKGSFYKATTSARDPSFFGSLVYKPSETASVYFTCDRVNAITGTANFGGVDGSGGTAAQLKRSLKAKSILYEVGYKESFLKNTLYVGGSVFQQTRIRPNLVGPASLIKTNGIEAELVYQPTRKLSFNANVTYQDATEYLAFFYEQTTNYLDGYPVGFIVDGKSGTGVGSPNFGGYVPKTGKARAAGVPGFMANAFVSYEFIPGFGLGVGPQIQGRQHANQEGTLNLPVQTQFDGYLFYRTKKWDVQMSVKNILNRRLYDTIDVGFAGNDVIYPRPGIAASLTTRFHF